MLGKRSRLRRFLQYPLKNFILKNKSAILANPVLFSFRISWLFETLPLPATLFDGSIVSASLGYFNPALATSDELSFWEHEVASTLTKPSNLATPPPQRQTRHLRQ
jgi:hypothetical protein